MVNKNLTFFERFILIIVAALTITGIISANTNVVWFEQVYAAEDGLVENVTLLPLLMMVCSGVYYLATLSAKRSRLFSINIAAVIVFSIFIAGEEISWGQRIFNIESTDFFVQNNAQKEVNLHNLVVNGKKVNKVIFSQLLTVVGGAYLLIFPVLYGKKKHLRELVDNAGIPVPRLYQTICCLLIFFSVVLIPSGKNAEIPEVGITHMFLLIFLFPENRHVFRKNKVSSPIRISTFDKAIKSDIDER
jgi:hypothetical protein